AEMAHPLREVGTQLLRVESGRHAEVGGGGGGVRQRIVGSEHLAVEKRSDLGVVCKPVDAHLAGADARWSHASALDADAMQQSRLLVDAGDAGQVVVACVASVVFLQRGGAVESEGSLQAGGGGQREIPDSQCDRNRLRGFSIYRDGRLTLVLAGRRSQRDV